MHTVIAVIVEANSEEQAIINAQRFVTRNLLTEVGGPFDYAVAMKEDSSPTSGANRWREYQDEPNAFPVHPIQNERGKDEIKSAWSRTKEHIDNRLAEVYKFIESADSLSEAQEQYLQNGMNIKHSIDNLSRKSPEVCLYLDGWNGAGIQSQRGWNMVVDYMNGETNIVNTVWVVPLDAHY